MTEPTVQKAAEPNALQAKNGYVVLARKWRPAQFPDIVGQNPIVRTLMNAIRAQRIHQAYLFTGSRGIGKTSIARIFAKVIRCENTRTENRDGIDWLKSCDECASCREIAAGSSVDVIEIDGASNNGVEAVREIRESARYMPASGGRKIYIIDEVHMLTTAAFNALLKTLEEPPEHVIFVFATTEPHKIPPTILSRCQRFDFRRVTPAQIQGRLTEVTSAEKVQAEPAALALIARAADGSMRDSLSLLDQVIAFSGDRITAQTVRESVGLIEGQTITGVLKAVFERKPLEAIALVDQAYQRGHDLRVLTRSLIEFLHGAILAKISPPGAPAMAGWRQGESPLPTISQEFSAEEWADLQAIAPLRELEEMELIFQVLHHGLEGIARSSQPKVLLDVLLIKCASGDALGALGVQVAASASAPARTTSATAPTASPSTTATASHPAASTVSVTASAQAAPVTPKATVSPLPVSPSAPKARDEGRGHGSDPGPSDSRGAPLAVTPAANNAAPPAPQSWEGFISHVRASRPLLASLLEHGHCGEITAEGPVVITYPVQDAYFKEQVSSRTYAEQINTLLKEYFGRPLRLDVQVQGKEGGGESVAAKREREQKEREQKARDSAQNHPIIREARALFGGELGPIEVRGSELNGGGP